MAELDNNLWAGQAKQNIIFWGKIVEEIHNSVKNICYKLLARNSGKKEDFLGRGIGQEKGIDLVAISALAARTPTGLVPVWCGRA